MPSCATVARAALGKHPSRIFYIGAHAESEGLKLLTRDASRYRTYFPAVHLIAP